MTVMASGALPPPARVAGPQGLPTEAPAAGGCPHASRRFCCSTLVAAALALVPALPAAAAKWAFSSSISVDETYTDNVRLSSRGFEEADWVTTINPRFSLRGSGDRLQIDIDYSPQFLYRAREGKSQTLQIYSAGGTVEFVKNALFLESRFSEAPQTISLFGPQPADNTNITDNRSSVRTMLISPFLRHDFGSAARGDARYSYSRLETDSETALFDSQASRIDVRLASGPAFKQLTWYTAYNAERIDYSQPQVQDIETRRFSAGGRQLITPQIGFLANAGYEDNVYPTSGPEPRGAFWNVGPEWNPTPRTRLAATVGRRYLGSTRSLDFSHRTRLTLWGLNYNEDITTTRSQFLIPTTLDTAGYLDTLFLSSITDPTARASAVSAFISRNGLPTSLNGPVNFFTNVPFLQKRLQASFGILGVRNTVLASLSTVTREALTPGQPGEGDFAQSEKTRQTGATALWTSRISARTSSNFTVSISRNDFLATGREDTQKFVKLGLTHEFLPKLSGSIYYRWLQNDSSNGVEYIENAVSASLRARF